LDLENVDYFSSLKGLGLVITGDITHPLWFKEISSKLEEAEEGVYKLKGSKSNVFFLLGGELSSIFSRKGEVKRIHYLIILPKLELVEKFNKKLSLYANLSSDGRPILGLDVKDVLKMLFDIYDKAIFIPAHIWTPWFSLYGSMSGFNSIYEAFDDLTNLISAVETGLSSDPNMNWRIPELDNFSIVSFSDAHSPSVNRIGREATLFELEKLTYINIYKALKGENENNKILMTVEFFPEEGKYHYDGHRLCKIRFSPEESRANNFLCPICQKKVTLGVMSRVEELSKRKKDFIDPQRPPFKRTPPLIEVLAEIFKSNVSSKKIFDKYLDLVKKFGPELDILVGNVNKEEILKYDPLVYKALVKIEKEEVILDPGYDGEYGKVLIEIDEDADLTKTKINKTLF